MEDFRKKRLKEDEESLWEQTGRKEPDTSRWVDWFKKRIIGEKTAREISQEKSEELKKKKNGF